jgi:methionine biosynthesis protein MetW|tara:strand:- start:1373 stop:1981 length:609 start_codon:yes stop_codon:yes gene_type:complete
MRHDLITLKQWIHPHTRVLDLGCGDGALLDDLVNEKNISGLGIEIDTDNITCCVGKGLSVIEQDIDKGLSNFSDNSFDTVLLTQTLQAVRRPDFVLEEMLRVGKECIITFPNFGHWQARWYLMLRGKMPVSKMMPYHWYDTPNIHFCTVKDFENLCVEKNIKIIHRTVQMALVGTKKDHRPKWYNKIWPNLFGAHAIYHVTR